MKPLFILLYIALAMTASINANDNLDGLVTTEEISKFTTTQDDGELAKHLTAIKRGEQSPQESAELLCAILAQADKYLAEHPKPTETPSRNIAPPNGGISGSDPESIADPAQRAAYKKLLEENRRLAGMALR